METSENIAGGRINGATARAVRRRMGAVALALGMLTIAAGGPRLSDADTSSGPPVSQCTDFACQG